MDKEHKFSNESTLFDNILIWKTNTTKECDDYIHPLLSIIVKLQNSTFLSNKYVKYIIHNAPCYKQLYIGYFLNKKYHRYGTLIDQYQEDYTAVYKGEFQYHIKHGRGQLMHFECLSLLANAHLIEDYLYLHEYPMIYRMVKYIDGHWKDDLLHGDVLSSYITYRLPLTTYHSTTIIGQEFNTTAIKSFYQITSMNTHEGEYVCNFKCGDATLIYHDGKKYIGFLLYIA